MTKSPQVTNYYAVTYASVFGDDPNPARDASSRSRSRPGPAASSTGAGTIDGVVTAIKRANGSTNGAALATQLEKFKKVPTIAGKVSFSRQLHTVFGRQYRVIQIQNNKAQGRRARSRPRSSRRSRRGERRGDDRGRK